MNRWIIAGITLLLCAAAGSAAASGAGSTLFALQVGQGTGDFVNPEQKTGSISISRDTRGQVEFGAEVWHLFTDDYALTAAAAIGTFREINRPGANAAANSREVRFSTSGLRFRLGGDRMVDLGHRLTVLAGPGIEYWSGRATYDNVFTPLPSSVKSARSTRIGLSGRIGAIMQLSDALGIAGHVGTTIGYATAKDAGARATWWPVGTESAWGLTYGFGGN